VDVLRRWHFAVGISVISATQSWSGTVATKVCSSEVTQPSEGRYSRANVDTRRIELIPHLSCWENQVEGVDQGAERGEASLNGLRVRERNQGEPRQQQAGADVGLQE
jgi:hypothetical protein